MSVGSLVHIIDDDDAVRESLSFLLASAGFAIKTHTAATAFMAANDVDVGCIITDVRMPALSGIDMLKELRRRGSHVPIIVITGHGDVPLAVEAMKLGAWDFFEKPFDDEGLLQSVRSALGNVTADHERHAREDEVRRRAATLSERESEVLAGLAEGRANKVIALDLGISPRTVEIYRANVMTKMQANSLSELVRLAMRAGLLND
jgi:two-component system, LuxR family, response regulator FixJ